MKRNKSYYGALLFCFTIHRVSDQARTLPPPGVCRLLSREPIRDFAADMFGLRPIDGVAVTRDDVGLVVPPFAEVVPRKTKH